jgi:hypothetical protein
VKLAAFCNTASCSLAEADICSLQTQCERVHWVQCRRALVNAEMVLREAEEFVTSWATISFSKTLPTKLVYYAYGKQIS